MVSGVGLPWTFDPPPPADAPREPRRGPTGRDDGPGEPRTRPRGRGALRLPAGVDGQAAPDPPCHLGYVRRCAGQACRDLDAGQIPAHPPRDAKGKLDRDRCHYVRLLYPMSWRVLESWQPTLRPYASRETHSTCEFSSVSAPPSFRLTLWSSSNPYGYTVSAPQWAQCGSADQTRNRRSCSLRPVMRFALGVGAVANLEPAIARRGLSVVSFTPIPYVILPGAIYCTPPGGDAPIPARHAQRTDPR